MPLRRERSIDKIRKLLLHNGHPSKLLNRLLRKVRSNDTSTQRQNGKDQRHFDGYLCLPYVDEEILCKIKSKEIGTKRKDSVAKKLPSSRTS